MAAWLHAGGVITGWMRGHFMDVQDRTDAVMAHDLIQYGPVLNYYGHQLFPLYFQREVILGNRPFLLQLEKMPFTNFLHKLTVRGLPLDPNEEGIIASEFYVNLQHAAYLGGTFHVVHKVSEESLSFVMTRATTPYYVTFPP